MNPDHITQARNDAHTLERVLSGALDGFTGTLLCAWTYHPTPFLQAQTNPNASAHARLIAQALAGRKDLAAAWAQWAHNAPLLWDHPTQTPPDQDEEIRGQIEHTVVGGKLVSVRVSLPSPTPGQIAWNAKRSSFMTPISKKGTELIRLLTALGSIQGPLARWTATQGNKRPHHFYAGQSSSSALVVERLIGAATTTLKKGALEWGKTDLILYRHVDIPDRESLAHALWK